MDPLLALTCAALAGLAARPNGGHGTPPETAEQIGSRAAELARGALKAIEPSEEKPAKARGR